MKPLIGIPMDLVPDIDNKLASGMPELMIALTPQATIDAVRAGGGDAVGLPLVKSLDEALELCQHIDGLVVPVGDDLAPESSGVPLGRYSGKSRLFKDESDIWYIKAMIQLHRPVFGCCRGMQLINSALGGNILRDAFGVVALVAMMPLLSIQVVGFYYQRKARKVTRELESYGDCDIIELWEEPA